MWLLLQWMPQGMIEFFVYSALGLGLAGTVACVLLRRLPLIEQYRMPVQVASVLLFCLGLYWLGGLDVEQRWQQRVQELETKVARAEQQATQRNQEIQNEVVERTRVIREKGKNIVNYIDREIVKQQEIIKYVENCPVPRVIIETHNAAAQIDATEPSK